MGLNEENLSYHGTVKEIEEAKKLVKPFPASMIAKSGALYLDIKMGFERLNIYPCKGYKIETINLPTTDLSHLVAHASDVAFSTKKGENYTIYYDPKEEGF